MENDDVAAFSAQAVVNGDSGHDMENDDVAAFSAQAVGNGDSGHHTENGDVAAFSAQAVGNGDSGHHTENGDVAAFSAQAVGNGDSGHHTENGDMAAFSAQAVGNGDSESSFWDIIADSHMKLESYNDQPYDQEMSELISNFMPSAAAIMSASMNLAHSSVPSTNLAVYEDFGTLPSSPLLIGNHQLFSGLDPSHFVNFGSRPDGTSFRTKPAIDSILYRLMFLPFCAVLSKPIVREDGLLLVGTEAVVDLSHSFGDKNRIFVTNFLNSPGSAQPPAHILVEREVRDIQWMGAQAAILAIGKEIQLIHLGSESCRLQNPINSVHSGTIRELAVSPTKSSYVLSGGFDETVVLTDLRNHGDPQAAAIIGKFDASDVVSSVRWAPSDFQLSWTTDGGDFQVVDTRVRSPQLQLPLYKFQNLAAFGGLFTHEYLSSFNIALGFERGHIAFVDIRMPRQHSCTSTIESKLTSTGEIRRSKTDKIAIFGRGGFSTANIDGTANTLEQITLQQQRTLPSYKTSGGFSYERGVYLAVSDNMGIVSVYTDDTIFGSSPPFIDSCGGW
ncbi:unnamed protein product [Peronospora effusa]|uniref:Uncharacterized protein n=1 Tax=Peronospora effusa TaxID=542832 RepID=A0A3R7XS19_9STRA|nr:hypothetical protein DD237_006402 [Peronospora effusa]CAI5702784.1 unnamed protein product [Peronospora effusa]